MCPKIDAIKIVLSIVVGWFYKLALLDFEIIFEDKLKVVE